MTAPVVVGIDDVDQHPHALQLAGREAEMRAAPLWIAHSYHRAPRALGIVPGGEVSEQTVLDTAVEPLAGAFKQISWWSGPVGTGTAKGCAWVLWPIRSCITRGVPSPSSRSGVLEGHPVHLSR